VRVSSCSLTTSYSLSFYSRRRGVGYRGGEERKRVREGRGGEGRGERKGGKGKEEEREKGRGGGRGKARRRGKKEIYQDGLPTGPQTRS
jgi:hypothetical protein